MGKLALSSGHEADQKGRQVEFPRVRSYGREHRYRQVSPFLVRYAQNTDL
jgi:hypothetical protein